MSGARTAPTSRERVVRLVEGLAIVLASVALSIGLIVALSGYFTARDPADVSGAADGPGRAFADLGDARLRPGQPQPTYDSDPPTSGAHVPEPVTRDGAQLNDNQLLQALALGDVVIMYGTSAPPPGLEGLASSVAGPFSSALAAAGQAVILARRPATEGLIGLAWAHVVYVSAPDDPVLKQFAQFWLGRGAAHR